MKKSLKTFLDSLKLFVLFMACTVMFYFGLKWLDEHYASAHKYDQPGDGAVKVVGKVSTTSQSNYDWTARFYEFLRDGQ